MQDITEAVSPNSVFSNLVKRFLLTSSLLFFAVNIQALELLEFWDTSDETNKIVVDHSVWQGLLGIYLIEHESGINRFDYQSLKSNEAAQGELTQYLLKLTEMDPRQFNRNEQMAYWINLYNALTVYVINNNYPVESIKDIKSGIVNWGPWDLELITIQDQSLTLNDIEHRILRPIWQDGRIHYAVNCASIGCPNLATEPYTSAKLESMLERAASQYINHPRGASVIEGALIVSSIYDWYKEDFGGTDEGVLAHLRKYAKPELIEVLSGFTSFDDYYDWNLNQP